MAANSLCCNFYHEFIEGCVVERTDDGSIHNASKYSLDTTKYPGDVTAERAQNSILQPQGCIDDLVVFLGLSRAPSSNIGPDPLPPKRAGARKVIGRARFPKLIAVRCIDLTDRVIEKGGDPAPFYRS